MTQKYSPQRAESGGRGVRRAARQAAEAAAVRSAAAKD
jgi:hypothetical protein